MKLALAQTNPVVGDIRRNTQRTIDFIDRARQNGADTIVFSELSLVGYPPRDLLRKDGFVNESVAAAEEVATHCEGISALVGYVRANPKDKGRPLQNVAAVCAEGRIQNVHVKNLLPTYDVFDETRYFEPGPKPRCVNVANTRVGLSICEDLWDSSALGRQLYGADPIALLRADRAEIIVNMAASPFYVGKAELREKLFARQAKRNQAPIVYVNQVGGNDELVFDGCSCVVDANGEVIARAKGFEEDLLIVDMKNPSARIEDLSEGLDSLKNSLQLGLSDYVHKCGFSSVVFGLSGGIDSALVAVIAADALGPENVYTLAMPSRYSSSHSVSDAEQLAKNLGIHYCETAIEDMHNAFDKVLSKTLQGGNREIADENIQARIRGNLVMAHSNAFGHLALATGNKSELSVGYCTLYGDMNGGLAPIGDVLKTDVYALCRHINDVAGEERIVENIITKPPSAELKPDQTDQEKLPEYDVLDGILKRYVDEDWTAHQIVEDGFDREEVQRIVTMVDRSEYKRKQAAPVLKVSPRAFGQGRRMPIAQNYIASGGS